MNKETNDGYKMDKYSKLLQDAVKNIVQKEEQNDLGQSLRKVVTFYLIEVFLS